MIGHALVKPELTGAQVMEGLEPAKRYHLRRGAKEIDMVVAISKLLSREFQHVQVELLQMSELCHIAASATGGGNSPRSRQARPRVAGGLTIRRRLQICPTIRRGTRRI
ncbi:MAG: hypothetical protein ABSG26_18245 [Bryobacteraceae bacterium]